MSWSNTLTELTKVYETLIKDKNCENITSSLTKIETDFVLTNTGEATFTEYNERIITILNKIYDILHNNNACKPNIDILEAIYKKMKDFYTNLDKTVLASPAVVSPPVVSPAVATSIVQPSLIELIPNKKYKYFAPNSDGGFDEVPAKFIEQKIENNELVNIFKTVNTIPIQEFDLPLSEVDTNIGPIDTKEDLPVTAVTPVPAVTVTPVPAVTAVTPVPAVTNPVQSVTAPPATTVIKPRRLPPIPKQLSNTNTSSSYDNRRNSQSKTKKTPLVGAEDLAKALSQPKGKKGGKSTKKRSKPGKSTKKRSKKGGKPTKKRALI